MFFRHKIVILVVLVLVVFPATSSVRYYATTIVKDGIKTLRVRYAGSNEVERPYLTLDGDERLEISFDQMSHDTHFYTFTLLHLNADFTQSSLMSSEYLEGFTTQDITDYDHSSLTQTLYTHYSFEFPNDDMRPKVSGNYAIKIYEDGNTDDEVAFVVFQIAEQTADIEAVVRSNTDFEFNGRYQQLDIDLDLRDNPINTPDEVTIVVQQNNRQDNIVVLNQPTFLNGQKLQYKNNRALIFEGGNEYRRFDISSEYIMGRNVDFVQFDHNNYHAFLFADENRATTPYVFEPDANGQFVVNAERRDDDDFEADYMFVHFMLPAPSPWFGGSIYVMGDFCFNRLADENRMSYDFEHKCYTYTTFLKQGAYEYLYVGLEGNKPQATTQFFEGSHWQTRNEYTIYVYYRPFSSRYHRLLAIKKL